MIEIVEGGTFQGGISERKAAWLNDIDSDAHTGAESKNRSDILSYIGLKEGDAH